MYVLCSLWSVFREAKAGKLQQEKKVSLARLLFQARAALKLHCIVSSSSKKSLSGWNCNLMKETVADYMSLLSSLSSTTKLSAPRRMENFRLGPIACWTSYRNLFTRGSPSPQLCFLKVKWLCLWVLRRIKLIQSVETEGSRTATKMLFNIFKSSSESLRENHAIGKRVRAGGRGSVNIIFSYPPPPTSSRLQNILLISFWKWDAVDRTVSLMFP